MKKEVYKHYRDSEYLVPTLKTGSTVALSYKLIFQMQIYHMRWRSALKKESLLQTDCWYIEWRTTKQEKKQEANSSSKPKGSEAWGMRGMS